MLSQDQQQLYLAAPVPEAQDPLSPPSERTVDSPSSPVLPSPSTIRPSAAFPREIPGSSFSSSTALRQHLRPHSASSTSPTPPQFADPYVYRTLHQHVIPPPLSSIGSVSTSTRSSTYTSSLRSAVFSNYGDLDDPFVETDAGSDEIIQSLAQHLYSSSQTLADAPTRWSQLQSGSRSRSPSVADSRADSLALSSSSNSGSDGDWRTVREREDISLASESGTDDDAYFDLDDEGGDEETELTSATIVAEGGRGVIVRGEGGSVHSIQAPPGTTHLLIASSATPNAVPSFLTNVIPQICETLLALDVSANFLGALSPALAMCHNLEELNIASNPLRTLPSFLSSLTSLRVLVVDATGIHTLPDSLTSLEKLHTLHIRRNNMHSLPGLLCLLPSLETLHVDGNPFQGPWKALVEPLLRREESTREFNTRALRSVLAYLQDMLDLSQPRLNVSRVPKSSTPDSNNLGSPMMGETHREVSEHFLSSTGLMGELRNGTERATSSTIAVDSTRSAEDKEKQAKADRVKGLRIIHEIIETERTYVKDLQELVDIYIKPACAPVNALTGGSRETVVPATERKIVFSNLEALFSFHKESFLPALEKAAGSVMQPPEVLAEADKDGAMSTNAARTVGDCFVSYVAFMRMYSTYINNMDDSIRRIEYWISERATPVLQPLPFSPSSGVARLVGLSLAEPTSMHTARLTSSQRKRIKSYMKRCRMNPRHSQLNLEGYLLLPVGRIPRYRLLLEELLKCSTQPSQYTGDPIERALTEISLLATGMAEDRREAEGRRKLVQWQARIRGKFPTPLVQPHRRLIMDGALSLTRVVRKATIYFEVIGFHGDGSTVQVECLAPETTPRALVGILCNDLLVLCRHPSQGQDSNSPVELWAVLRMQTLPQPASIVHGNALRLVDNKAVLYFDAPSPSEALNWCKAINLHIPPWEN